MLSRYPLCMEIKPRPTSQAPTYSALGTGAEGREGEVHAHCGKCASKGA